MKEKINHTQMAAATLGNTVPVSHYCLMGGGSQAG